MAWTTPKTWTAVVVTVSDLNTHLRDNLNILKTRISDDGTTWHGGVFLCDVFGSHSVSAGGTGGNVLFLRNTTAGTGNYAQIRLGTDAAANTGFMHALSTTFTTSAYNVADGVTYGAIGAGGLSVAADHAAGAIRLYSGGSSERMRVHASGAISVGNTYDIGAAGNVTINSELFVGYTGGGGSTEYVELSNATLIIHSFSFGAQVTKLGFSMSSWQTTASAANANVANGAEVKLVTSLRANKHSITSIDATEALHVVQALRPVLYRSAVDADQRQWPGFIAEDVEEAAPPLAVYGSGGALQAVAYDRVAAYVVAAVQGLEARVQALEGAA